MKKYLIIPFFIILISCGVSKINVTEKYIQDITSFYAQGLPDVADESLDCSVFWDYILEKNRTFQEYKNNNSKLKKETSKKIIEMAEGMPKIHEHFKDLFVLKENAASAIAGTKYKGQIKAIFEYEDDRINAFATPDGYIYLHRGLINLFNEDYDQYLGVLAHEVAHILLRHAEQHKYAEKKRERNAEISRGITAGILGAGAILGSVHMASSGVDAESIGTWSNAYATNAITFGRGISDAVDLFAFNKIYEYSREQEIEADIVAVLFLKWVGGPVQRYINLLSKMPDYEIQENASHPTNKFRAQVLNNFLNTALNYTIYEHNGKKYNVPAEQVQSFLERKPDAKKIN